MEQLLLYLLYWYLSNCFLFTLIFFYHFLQHVKSLHKKVSIVFVGMQENTLGRVEELGILLWFWYDTTSIVITTTSTTAPAQIPQINPNASKFSVLDCCLLTIKGSYV